MLLGSKETYYHTVRRSNFWRDIQLMQKEPTTRRVDPTPLFHGFANQNHPRYRAETLHKHNTPNHHQNHTNKGKTIKQRGKKNKKTRPLWGLGNSPSSITRQRCPKTSLTISSSLLLQEPPSLIRRLVIRTIMECNHSANNPQLMQIVLVKECQLY